MVNNNSDDLWTMISIINSLPDLVYFINHEGHLVICNKNFRDLLKIASDFSDLPYNKLCSALNMDEYEIGEIQKDDFVTIFSKESLNNGLLIERENKKPRYFKFHREIIFEQNNRNVAGVLVIIREEQHLPEKEEKAFPYKKEVVLNHPPKVLLVEDNPLARVVTSVMFKKHGCEVDAAEKDTEALPLFDSKQYDLIIMDLGLPGSPGRVVTKEIRSREAAKGVKESVPIIGLTAFVIENVIEDCKHYKMNGLLSKPITDDQVVQVLERFVNHKNIEVDSIIYLDGDEK